MGRVAYITETRGLPPAAREEAEQREHENDDQDDPENAQCSHLLRASFSRERFSTSEVPLNPCARSRQPEMEGASASCSALLGVFPAPLEGKDKRCLGRSGPARSASGASTCRYV